MKALIVNKLNQPIVTLALLDLTRLLVRVDFNMAQAAFLVAMQGLRYSWQRILPPTRARRAARRQSAAPALASRAVQRARRPDPSLAGRCARIPPPATQARPARPSATARYRG